MNPWAASLLGAGGLLSGLGILYQIYNGLRDQKIDRTRKETGVALDDTTRTRIAAEAAQINSDVAIAQQNWWKEQFDYVRTELVMEQSRRKESDDKVEKLMSWAREHELWDEAAYANALKTDPDYPAPPRLEIPR